MKKLIKQIICSFIAIVTVIGFTTASANAQLAPNVISVSNDTANYVIVAQGNEDEPNNIEGFSQCNVVCKPGDTYLVNPSDSGSFYQCSNGVSVFQPCPAGLVFNPNLNVCD